MSKILIVPDIHLKIDIVDRIIEEVKPTKIIFGNDIFDDYNDIIENNIRAAKWFKDKIQNSKNIFLQSNHVISYQFPYNPNAYCSGFTQEKSDAINSIVSEDDFKKLKTYHIEHDILFTHAGLSRMWCKTYMGDDYKHLNLETIRKFLDYKTPLAYDLYSIGTGDSMFGAGRSRGGNLQYGGLIWEDLYSFFPIKSVSQIFFHTIVNVPKFIFTSKSGYGQVFDYNDIKVVERFKREPKFNPNSFNLAIDTNLRNYAIIEDNKLKLYNTKDFEQIFEKNLKS